jgi:hypothetical protein
MSTARYLLQILAANWPRSRLARLAAAALALFVLATATGQEPVYDATQVKAAFLYHFGTYVQWPTDAATTDPITIAVLGDAVVAAQLAEFLPGRRIADRPVQVRPLTRIEELADEELLFIGSAHNARLPQLIAAVGRRPVLVVTDADDGLERGAMVNFRLVDSRVRFEISVPRADEAGLMLSARLLSAALRVITSECCALQGTKEAYAVKQSDAVPPARERRNFIAP